MSNITKSYNWVIEKCNAKNIGYSQTYRNQETVNGNTYYDCSSFIWYALKAGGFNCEKASGSSYPFTTDTMRDVLIELGFSQMYASEQWKPGDILWRDGHTEMVYQGLITMGAKSQNYVLDKQVSISENESSKDDWTLLYRFGAGVEGGSYNWIVYDTDEAGKMSLADQQNNVMIIFSILTTKYGWTREAIAGALGSMQIESYFNPGQWELGHKSNTEDGYGFGYGYGLIQWTRPGSSYPNPYLNYCYENDIDRLNGDEQLRYLNEGIENSNLWGWIETGAYPYTFSEYIRSTASPEHLALAWLYNLERPPEGDPTAETRQEKARYWYDWLKGKEPFNPNQNKKKALSKLLLFAIATDRF